MLFVAFVGPGPFEVIMAIGEVEAVKFASPEYVAVIECVPAESEDVVKVAEPERSFDAPIIEAPSLKMTDSPLGICTDDVTVAVKIIYCPLELEVNEVEVAAGLMLSVTGLLVLGARNESPPYLAVNVCGPPDRLNTMRYATPEETEPVPILV